MASQKQLREVQAKIAALSKSMQARTRKRDALSAALADTETQLAEATLNRQSIAKQQREARDRLALAEQRADLQRRSLATERDELGRQLHAAYTSGRQERLKLVLNQQSPAALGRMMVYYRYLNEARMQNMRSLQKGLDTLQRLMVEAQAERDTLDGLARQADVVIAELAAGRRERQGLIADIERQLRSESKTLKKLNEEEQALSDLLAELSEILADYPTSSEEPIKTLRGKLTWPVAGSLIAGFGDNRSGGRVRSKGIVLGAETGTEVRAIYHGRIAFADWLPGMGLLIIVDHGEGVLSLYGYNETLLKSVGDWVSPGDVIATVGNTGGRSVSALYFELRQGTKAVNPRPWFRNRPGSTQR